MTTEEATERGLARLREAHDDVFVIVSPPRCSSTAVARLLWEQPSVRYYCHEPFEVTYYEGLGLDAVFAKLAAPLDLARLTSRPPAVRTASPIVSTSTRLTKGLLIVNQILNLLISPENHGRARQVALRF